MYCSNCGENIQHKTNICPKCGRKIKKQNQNNKGCLCCLIILVVMSPLLILFVVWLIGVTAALSVGG